MGIYLDDRFTEHPKFVAAGDEAGWLWLCALAYVNRNNLCGEILKNQIPKLTTFKRPAKLAERLVAVGLWYDKDDRYVFHDYEERNAAQIARSEKSSHAAKERWRKHRESIAPGNAPSMPEHCPSNAVPHTTNHKGVTNQALSEPPRSKTDAERDQLIAAAVDVLAEQDLTANNPRDPQAWIITARQRRHVRHVRQLRAALNEHGDWTPEQLAAWVDPDIPGLPVHHDTSVPASTYTPPDCDNCHGSGVYLDDAGLAHICDHQAA